MIIYFYKLVLITVELFVIPLYTERLNGLGGRWVIKRSFCPSQKLKSTTDTGLRRRKVLVKEVEDDGLTTKKGF